MSNKREFVYLNVNAIIRIHANLMEEEGNEQQIRDLSIIESAIEGPKEGFGDTEFYPGVFQKAAEYAFRLSQGQGFSNGNKRIGIVAALTFLEMNGHEISESFDDQMFEGMRKISSKEWDREDLADMFRDLVCATMTETIDNK